MTDPHPSTERSFLAAVPDRGPTAAYLAGLSTVLGTGVGTFSAAAYYSDSLRPLAHSYGIWVSFAVVLALGRPLHGAIVASTTFLSASVAVFFLGVKVFHDLKWASSGSTLNVSWDRMTLWLALAIPAGLLFGLAGHLAAAADVKGDVSRAGVVGVLAAEALDRLLAYGLVDAAVLLDSAAAVGLLTYFYVSRLRLRRSLALAPVFLIAALVFLQAPDVLEQLIV